MSHNTLLHRTLRRPIRLLADTPVTPDMLTVLRLATGLGAAACFAHGGAADMPGAILLLLSCLLDRADGELARQTRRFSRFGSSFDLVADCTATMACFIGMGIGATLPDPSDLLGVDWQWPVYAGPVLGTAGAIGVAIIFMQLNMMPQPGAARTPVSRPFDPDDAMVLLPVAIWFGGAGWLVVGAGLVTPVVAVVLALSRGQARSRPRISVRAASKASHSASVPTVMRR